MPKNDNPEITIGDLFGVRRIIDIRYPTEQPIYTVQCVKCGNHKNLRKHELPQKRHTSCKCQDPRMSANKLIGYSIGYLTVIRKSTRKYRRNFLWECSCKCGHPRCKGTVLLRWTQLRNPRRKSCGALFTTETYIGADYSNAKARAANRNLPFELSYTQFETISLSYCYYCNAAPSRPVLTSHSRKQGTLINGIDRIDSSKGYTQDNCVPCCTTCNTAKLDKPQKDFYENTRTRAEHMYLKGYITPSKELQALILATLPSASEADYLEVSPHSALPPMQ